MPSPVDADDFTIAMTRANKIIKAIWVRIMLTPSVLRDLVYRDGDRVFPQPHQNAQRHRSSTVYPSNIRQGDSQNIAEQIAHQVDPQGGWE